MSHRKRCRKSRLRITTSDVRARTSVDTVFFYFFFNEFFTPSSIFQQYNLRVSGHKICKKKKVNEYLVHMLETVFLFSASKTTSNYFSRTHNPVKNIYSVFFFSLLSFGIPRNVRGKFRNEKRKEKNFHFIILKLEYPTLSVVAVTSDEISFGFPFPNNCLAFNFSSFGCGVF